MKPFIFCINNSLNLHTERQVNREAVKRARDEVMKNLLKELDSFIRENPDSDIIVDTSDSRFFVLPNKYRVRKNIFLKRINAEKVTIYSKAEYVVLNVALSTGTVRIFEGENSEPPEYVRINDSYVLKDKEYLELEASDKIYLKAVNRGEAK